MIYSLIIIIAVYFSFALFFGFVYAPSKIEGSSMEDTIFDGDWLLIKKIHINPDQLQRGDIIIMKGEPKRFTLLWFLNDSEIAKRFMPSPIGEDWIKRIVAVEGDVVDLQKDSIYINGVRLIEPYLKDRNTTYDKHLIEFPYTVPEGEFFIMGDNRLVSHDSRNIGSIKGDEIIGISKFRILPLSRFGKID
jgi:signal peptidase I